MQSRFSWIPLTTGLTVLVLTLALAVLTVSRGGFKQAGTTNQDIRSQATEVSGSMSLSPNSGDYSFGGGSMYPVGLIVDSAGKSLDGIDVIINFDPTKVQVVGSSLSVTDLFERYPLNKVDNVAGRIQFSALTFNPRPVVGIVATFSYKPLKSGTVNFKIDFTPGSTTDSNLAEHGTAKDVLGKVENGNYVFK